MTLNAEVTTLETDDAASSGIRHCGFDAECGIEATCIPPPSPPSARHPSALHVYPEVREWAFFDFQRLDFLEPFRPRRREAIPGARCI
jgi:hypothetical protein